jgi:hypothetical protein
LPFPFPSTSLSDTPLPLKLPVSLLLGAICQAGILLPPFPGPNNALAAAVVDDPLPFGVDVPVVVPVVEAWGWVIFCLERRRVLSDFNSD